jgi:hypothetical protein
MFSLTTFFDLPFLSGIFLFATVGNVLVMGVLWPGLNRYMTQWRYCCRQTARTAGLAIDSVTTAHGLFLK